jgi:phospholipid/cholesterol/gamma-HCH transport system ATP-binding protein
LNRAVETAERHEFSNHPYIEVLPRDSELPEPREALMIEQSGSLPHLRPTTNGRRPMTAASALDQQAAQRTPDDPAAAIEFVDVHKAFGANQVLRGLNFSLPEGQISMLVGPSGTGKSVCIKHMIGLLRPDAGDVLVRGQSVPRMKERDLLEMRKRFGVLFQDGALFGSIDLFDNVAFPLRRHTHKSEAEIAEIVQFRLSEVGLGNSAKRYPNELSGGMRKRAGFARALVLDPDIVLFDEPDSGLDPVRTALLGQLIQEIHEEILDARRGTNGYAPAFTLITHDVMTARRVAQYICVLWNGRVVEEGPAQKIFDSPNPFVRQFFAGDTEGPLGME